MALMENCASLWTYHFTFMFITKIIFIIKTTKKLHCKDINGRDYVLNVPFCRKHYLLSPYLVNGDLFQAIAYDRSHLDIRLKFQIRMKIMYQIASAIDFMHTGNEFRFVFGLKLYNGQQYCNWNSSMTSQSDSVCNTAL